MAIRPVFLPSCDSRQLFIERDIEFTWHPGFSVQQKQKSIESLHSRAKSELNIESILEISTKSPIDEGVRSSAFNLLIPDKNGSSHYSVESAFQSAKVFERGGPFSELRNKSSIEAKKDPRLKSHGKLQKFVFFNKVWSLTPKTAFYDWLYINALYQHAELYQKILTYEAFTDIEFNPQKSLNCQARSAAIFVTIFKKFDIQKILSSKKLFLEIYPSNNGYSDACNMNQHLLL